MITRRGLLEAAGGALALSAAGSVPAWSGGAGEQQGQALLSPLLPAGTRAIAVLDTLPGKKPLIRLTSRPPNYEAPLAYLRTPITANDEFFVRYHLAEIPQIDAATWKLHLGGEGANGNLQIGLDGLKTLPAFEVAAVCQCAGNHRGLLTPHAAGVQWGHGAIGCARWKGARLKDVLDLVGLKEDAVEIVFDGADGPVLDRTPDFVKSLPVWKAVEEMTLVAYEMNGEPLPHWNGFPARIVVPGWAATYWVKHIASINAVTRPFDGYWMKTAYRIPVGKIPLVERFASQMTDTSTPITEIPVDALITSPSDGARVKAGSKLEISGFAWDGGYGIRSVEISTDNGKTWAEATVGQDLGVFAFRPWIYEFTPKAHGNLSLCARATNRLGQTQPREAPIHSGYYQNAIQTLTVGVL